MTRRIPLVLAVAIAAVAVGVGAGMFSAARHHTTPTTHEGTGAAGGKIVQALHFTSKDSSSGYVDNAPKGWSTGDILAQHSIWYQGGKAVADMALTATVTLRTSAQTGEVMFTAVAGLKDGDVAMTGKFDVLPRNQTFQAAVTGGTGAYAGVRGHAVFEQVSGNRTLITLYLAG
jgi:hypothetical protein